MSEARAVSVNEPHDATVAAPMWEKDSEVHSCNLCLDNFTFTSRKHHCRACGRIFCKRCTDKERDIPWLQNDGPVRVCDSCCRKLDKDSARNNVDLTASTEFKRHDSFVLTQCRETPLSDLLERLAQIPGCELIPPLTGEIGMCTEEARLLPPPNKAGPEIPGMVLLTQFRVLFLSVQLWRRLGGSTGAESEAAAAEATKGLMQEQSGGQLLRSSQNTVRRQSLDCRQYDLVQETALSTVLWHRRIDAQLQLDIQGKDLRRMKLRVSTYAALNKLAQCMHQLLKEGQPRAVRLCTAGGANPTWRYCERVRSDYQRILARQHNEQTAWSWTFNETVNENWQLCPTYPAVLCTPARLEAQVLTRAAAYRSKRRLPALSWISEHGAAICRCAQPNVGMRGHENAADTALVQEIATLSPSNSLVIVDARPHQNALLNRVRGGGYEDVKTYVSEELASVSIEFMDLDNIHVVRHSWEKLLKCCHDRKHSDDPRTWHMRLASTRWLEHIAAILRAASRVAELVDGEHTSVLVHCSDGWDRTPQITALTQILLDGHYRTFDGLCSLVDKEWLSFGHCFDLRTGLTSGQDDDFAPIFVQFVDCLWQLLRQFPTAFEYSAPLLLAMVQHCYTGRFGTFLCNNEKARTTSHLLSDADSFWEWAAHKKADFLNEFWEPDRWRSEPLVPNTTAAIRLWSAYYQANLAEDEISTSDEVANFLAQKMNKLEAVAAAEAVVERVIAEAEHSALRRELSHVVVSAIVDQLLNNVVHTAQQQLLDVGSRELDAVQTELSQLRVQMAELLRHEVALQSSSPLVSPCSAAPAEHEDPCTTADFPSLPSTLSLSPSTTLSSEVCSTAALSPSAARPHDPYARATTHAARSPSNSTSRPVSNSSAQYPRSHSEPVTGSYKEMPKQLWATNESSNLCTSCNAEFGFFRRRHHCRRCGKIFCSKCSACKFSLADVTGRNSEVQRVCRPCHQMLSVDPSRSPTCAN